MALMSGILVLLDITRVKFSFDAGQQMRITGVRCDENGRRIVSVRIMT